MIVLADLLRQALIEAAVAAQPHECCGLLVGRTIDGGTAVISRIAASRNVTPEASASSFEIDPSVRFSLMRELRGTGEAIIGHYHSHPLATAAPSARDLSRVYEPELVWLIIGLGGGRAEIRAWRYDQGTADFAPLSIASDTAMMPHTALKGQKLGTEPPSRRS
jgi:proteasome lid subunit RPN8/RPN11